MVQQVVGMCRGRVFSDGALMVHDKSGHAQPSPTALQEGLWALWAQGVYTGLMWHLCYQQP